MSATDDRSVLSPDCRKSGGPVMVKSSPCDDESGVDVVATSSQASHGDVSWPWDDCEELAARCVAAVGW